MKKILTLLAVAVALPVLFSCNKDKQADAKTIPTGAMIADAATFANADMGVTTNADGSYIAWTTENKTAKVFSFMFGTYSVSGNVYTLKDEKGNLWATLTVISATQIHFTSESEGLDMDIPVTTTKPDIANPNETLTNHSWNPVSLIVEYRGVNFTQEGGVDFNALEAWGKANWPKDFTKPIFDENMKMTKAIFSNAKVGFSFANGKRIAADFNAKNGLSFNLEQLYDGKDPVELMNGQATIEFSEDKCILGIQGDLNNVAARAIITFKLF
ncbi:MAG: hypothetical protein J6Y32_00020 [Bacteroidales bacterium]|nr:hypothetical protein [Bacteroidales bacterium]